MIEKLAKEIMAVAIENGDRKSLLLATESMQRLYEYLDALEIAPLNTDVSVTIKVDGAIIQFPSIEEVAKWITTKE